MYHTKSVVAGTHQGKTLIRMREGNYPDDPRNPSFLLHPTENTTENTKKGSWPSFNISCPHRRERGRPTFAGFANLGQL